MQKTKSEEVPGSASAPMIEYYFKYFWPLQEYYVSLVVYLEV